MAATRRRFRLLYRLPGIRDGGVADLKRGEHEYVRRTTFRGHAAHRLRGADGAEYLVLARSFQTWRIVGMVREVTA